jgi:hypothetical protein
VKGLKIGLRINTENQNKNEKAKTKTYSILRWSSSAHGSGIGGSLYSGHSGYSPT